MWLRKITLGTRPAGRDPVSGRLELGDFPQSGVCSLRGKSGGGAMGAAEPGMAWIPGGEFWMGSAGFYAEERPEHRGAADGFGMDARPVTVAEFRRFVNASGYRTVAERPPDPAAYPGADPELL